ncbi:MAG TPA: TetR/AcrR family transcriptional regulator [Pseudonocardiaceae bacterium]|jgi:AcrR family transcriptional regulator|nr:TetR/AcrR family transcriptional regulator [Pseudonocardiaceae bacterium]
MSTAGRSKPRERVLDTASTLFYREGIHAVSIDRLCAEAHVSKRSLYQYFENRDAILTEMLRSRGAAMAEGVVPAEDDVRTPRQRMLAVFDIQRTRSGSPDYLGCPFANTAIELKDRAHPATVAARAYKQELTAFFHRQAQLGGAADPGLLATQLTVLFDGASAQAVLNGELSDATRKAADTLLSAGGVG